MYECSCSEIISKNGSVEYGPELPKAVHAHAITDINATVSILSGGATSNTYPFTISHLTWYYNHDTKKFKRGPRLVSSTFLIVQILVHSLFDLISSLLAQFPTRTVAEITTQMIS